MNIFENILVDGMTVGVYLLGAVVALLCGLIVAFTSSFKARATRSFFTSLIVLPLAIHTVILMVNGNIGAGIAVAGAFSLIRFRSVPAKAKEIVAIFVAMTAGLACASGYVGIAVLFTVIACACLILLSLIKLKSDREQELLITVPENLHFTGAFDEVFEKYTSKAMLTSVKSANMGSLYKLTYIIEMKDESQLQSFIDDLRIRNGNLEITVFKRESGVGEL